MDRGQKPRCERNADQSGENDLSALPENFVGRIVESVFAGVCGISLKMNSYCRFRPG